MKFKIIIIIIALFNYIIFLSCSGSDNSEPVLNIENTPDNNSQEVTIKFKTTWKTKFPSIWANAYADAAAEPNPEDITYLEFLQAVKNALEVDENFKAIIKGDQGIKGDPGPKGDPGDTEICECEAERTSVRANGIIIGEAYIEYFDSPGPIQLIFSNNFDPISLYSDGKTNESALYYPEQDCSGTPYIMAAFSDNYFFPALHKGQLAAFGSQLYYSPRNELFIKFSYKSRKDADGCKNLINNNSQSVYTKAYPNKITATGITQYPFQTPITIDGLQSTHPVDN